MGNAASMVTKAINGVCRLERCAISTALHRSESTLYARTTATIYTACSYSPPLMTIVDVQLCLSRFHDKAPNERTVRLKLERFALKAFGALTTVDEHHYQLQLSSEYVDADLDEVADELLGRMHSIATDHQCMLEAAIVHHESGRRWD